MHISTAVRLCLLFSPMLYRNKAVCPCLPFPRVQCCVYGGPQHVRARQGGCNCQPGVYLCSLSALALGCNPVFAHSSLVCALQRFTYRGPNLSMLLGAARAPRLAVISVPGLPENRPGLVTGAMQTKISCFYLTTIRVPVGLTCQRIAQAWSQVRCTVTISFFPLSNDQGTSVHGLPRGQARPGHRCVAHHVYLNYEQSG
jgi:hypothetical protein